MRLKERVAVITGGGSGIGRACCLLFSREGAKVVAGDVDTEGVEQTAALIREEGGTCIPLTVDVSQRDDIDRLIQTVSDGFGRLDILVNNAGILLQKGLLDTTEEEWDRVQTINLKSVFLCSKRAIPEMLKKGKGKIINLASLAGVCADPFHAAYASSKAGVAALTRAMALEFARRGIRINCVSPGAVRTNIAIPSDQLEVRNKMDGIPIGYIAEPEDVARVVIFLASDDSDYLVGENIMVDGGVSKNLYPLYFSSYTMHRELMEKDADS